jgi:CubicO group peptidase (beta-lactamase class C family)
MRKIIFPKAAWLSLLMVFQQAIAQEWVIWAQEKYLTGYFTGDKFSNKTFEPSATPRDLPRKTLTAREEEKARLMTELFDKASTNLAMLAIDRGHVVLERYKKGLGPQTKFFSYSMSKSLTAYTVGLGLCDKGTTDLRRPAQSIAPALEGTSFGLSDIHDLLTMSSGANNWSLDVKNGTIKDEWVDLFEYRRRAIPDVLRAFDSTPKSPGTFAYKNSDTNSLPFLLGTSEDFLNAVDKHLIQPAGLADKSYWLRDKNGYVSAAAGFSATLQDWGRLASHSLRILDGDHGDCPKRFMNAATSAQVKNAAYGYDYGYQTWVHQRGPVFIWMGVYGQRTFVDKVNHKILILLRSSEGDDFVTQVTRTYWTP